MKEYITLTVDGKSVKIEKGSTLLEAARKAGADIPTLCHDERVKPYGACGMCVVECKGSPKLMRSCAIEAADGMEIITESDRINRARRFSLEMLLSDHTGDCKAPCSLACPAGTDCQGYVGLIANGENAQALSVIKGRIPLPASIGRVCPHPCEKKCRRGVVEDPISIAALKAYAADRDLESGNIFMPEVAESTGKKVAIIGGGPGGISAAYYLAIKGHGVTVFDMMPKMGGMLRYGIPQYRLPKEVLDKELALVEKLGVEFRNNIKIGRDISLDTLNQEYDAVIAAPGAWSSTKMRVDGEDAEGVFGGIDFLRSVILGSPVDIGKRVAVCGGGNTAMDACRTAVRLGAEKVYIIYRRTRDEMPADALEIDEAQEEGVDFRFLTNPDKILTQDGKVCGIKLQIMELGEPDVSGRRKPVPIEGKFETLEVDSVIMAIGQKPELSGFEELDTTSRGTISADESTFRTNISGIFAIGDATNKGADIAISAIGEAQKSASVVDSYLRGNIIGYKKPILVEREITADDLADREHIAREKMRVLPPDKRKRNFDEVTLGFTDEQARREASRCLECGCLDYYRCKLVSYANKYDADFSRFVGEKSPAKKGTAGKVQSYPFYAPFESACGLVLLNGIGRIQIRFEELYIRIKVGNYDRLPFLGLRAPCVFMRHALGFYIISDIFRRAENKLCKLHGRNIGLNHRKHLVGKLLESQRTCGFRLLYKCGYDLSLAVRAHKIRIKLSYSAVDKRLRAVHMNALARLYLSRRSCRGAHKLRLFLGNFNIYSADGIDYCLEHIESDEHIVVYLDIIVILDSVNNELRSAVCAGGVKLVIGLCRRNNSPGVAQK